MTPYFNGYPASYQPLFQPVQAPAQQAQQSGIIWVQGEAAAKSYLVAPGSTVQLRDSEEKTIYLKSADPSGMPSMKILDYTIRGGESAQAVPAAEYATKDDLKALEEKIRDEIGRRRSRLTKEDGDE